MKAGFPYAKLLEAGAFAPTELTDVGTFAHQLPSVRGRVFPQSDEQLLAEGGVPDPKCARHVARSGCLLLLHYRELLRVVQNSGVPGQRIGIYATMSQSPLDWEAMAAIAKAGPAQLSTAMRKALPRKQIFKTSAYSGVTQLGILLGITGPQLTFFDEREDFPFMIDQARFELQSGDVDLAILAAANALDDPLALLGAADPREASVCLVAGRAEAALLGKRALRIPESLGAAGGLAAFLEGAR